MFLCSAASFLEKEENRLLYPEETEKTRHIYNIHGLYVQYILLGFSHKGEYHGKVGPKTI